MVSLTSREAENVFRIMGVLANDYSSQELRQKVGTYLLDLFDAQYFASYVWSQSRAVFDDRVAINMSADNLSTYETYFQFRDPITPLLQRRRRASSVAHVITRRRLERTEFFNDFLARDGLHYGMNYYAYSGGLNIGDLRIWRGRKKEDFSRREIAVLDAIGPAFTNAMRVALAREGHEDGVLLLANAIDRLSSPSTLTAPRKRDRVRRAARQDRQADRCRVRNRIHDRAHPPETHLRKAWGFGPQPALPAYRALLKALTFYRLCRVSVPPAIVPTATIGPSGCQDYRQTSELKP